jgi:hypothetical protein
LGPLNVDPQKNGHRAKSSSSKTRNGAIMQKKIYNDLNVEYSKALSQGVVKSTKEYFSSNHLPVIRHIKDKLTKNKFNYVKRNFKKLRKNSGDSGLKVKTENAKIIIDPTRLND